ncbi:probable E3 ubiquitin-protein ligase bre1 [Cydia strobilella]|uniref:probable E3 ubiquitin-protein ligase bre1 n=1 Tax=Cydia strobilella TaxID=1100964 RepID=UPI003005F663
MSQIMENTCVGGEELMKLHLQIADKDKQEDFATAAVTTETITKLNVSIDALPQKTQLLLQKASQLQQALDIDQLDPIAISLRHSRELADELDDEYELLKLTQKNEVLQRKIDRNNKFMEELRRELTCSRESLRMQNPNPENIQELMRQMRQKVFAYEESCELAKTKFNKLSVPEPCYPKSLALLASTLESLRAEALSLQQRAEDITLAREARELLGATRR